MKKSIIGFALAVGLPTLGPAQEQVPAIDADTAPATATAALPPPVNRVSPRAAPLTSKERRAVNLANESGKAAATCPCAVRMAA